MKLFRSFCTNGFQNFSEDCVHCADGDTGGEDKEGKSQNVNVTNATRHGRVSRDMVAITGTAT